MVDDLGRSMSYSLDGEAIAVAEARMPSPSPEYDLTDGALRDFEFAMDPRPKRQRAGDFPSNGFTLRLGTKFPSLSQKWRNKRAGKAASIVDSINEARPTRSRANSTRASSVIGSDGPEKDHQPPMTPAQSIHDEAVDPAQTSTINISKANAHHDEAECEMKASTPLLPPIMANAASYLEDVPFQSPLQSPTIADQDCPSIAHTPIAQTPITHNPITTPQLYGLPSPPLSTRPSVSSFHRHPLLPSSEIPPLPLAAPNDPWTDKLGHANFTIAPEPYVPTSPSLAACKQIRADWDQARCNYTKHLMRTTEHYGATSKIHRLTEDKWSEIDAEWKRNSETCVAAATSSDKSDEDALELSQPSVAEPAPLIKVPSLNGPRSEGKFPKLGDEFIVGPMEQGPAQIQTPRRTSKKRTFLKFLQGMLPNGGGMFGREKSP